MNRRKRADEDRREVERLEWLDETNRALSGLFILHNIYSVDVSKILTTSRTWFIMRDRSRLIFLREHHCVRTKLGDPPESFVEEW